MDSVDELWETIELAFDEDRVDTDVITMDDLDDDYNNDDWDDEFDEDLNDESGEDDEINN